MSFLVLANLKVALFAILLAAFFAVAHFLTLPLWAGRRGARNRRGNLFFITTASDLFLWPVRAFNRLRVRGKSATNQFPAVNDFAGLPELPPEFRQWDGPFYLPAELALARKLQAVAKKLSQANGPQPPQNGPTTGGRRGQRQGTDGSDLRGSWSEILRTFARNVADLFISFLGGKLAAGGVVFGSAIRRLIFVCCLLWRDIRLGLKSFCSAFAELVFRAQRGGQPARRGVSLAVGLLLAASSAQAGHRHLESWYADALAEELGARTEVRLRNGTRCDVLATHHAIEVDFAPKWCEAIGQALCYASQTGRTGTVALILEQPGDEKFLTRLREVITWHQLPLVVTVLKPFGEDGLELRFPEGMHVAKGARQ